MSYAEVLGTKYQKGVVVLVTFDDDIPIFGRIKDIYVTASGECLFVFVPVGALFNYHYHSYEVHAVHNQFNKPSIMLQFSTVPSSYNYSKTWYFKHTKFLVKSERLKE